MWLRFCIEWVNFYVQKSGSKDSWKDLWEMDNDSVTEIILYSFERVLFAC